MPRRHRHRYRLVNEIENRTSFKTRPCIQHWFVVAIVMWVLCRH